VARAVTTARLDAVQLHGDEHPRRFARCGAPLIRAISLLAVTDVTRAGRLPRSLALLVDARDPIRRGGTGTRANWALARRLAKRRAILLAGGLTAGNVARAIRAVRPWAVDVSSGVELRPGVKSERKIRALMAAVARADRGQS